MLLWSLTSSQLQYNVEMCTDLADAQGELRADCNVRKKEDIDLKVDLGACKKKMRHEEIQFFKVFD